MDIQISLRELAFNSFGYIRRSGIAGSFVSSTLIKKKNYTILHFNQQCTRVPNSQFSFLFFLIVAFLIGVKCYVTVVFIFISLMIRDFKRLFTCYWSFLFLFGDMSIHLFCLYLNQVLLLLLFLRLNNFLRPIFNLVNYFFFLLN